MKERGILTLSTWSIFAFGRKERNVDKRRPYPVRLPDNFIKTHGEEVRGRKNSSRPTRKKEGLHEGGEDQSLHLGLQSSQKKKNGHVAAFKRGVTRLKTKGTTFHSKEKGETLRTNRREKGTNPAKGKPPLLQKGYDKLDAQMGTILTDRQERIIAPGGNRELASPRQESLQSFTQSRALRSRAGFATTKKELENQYPYDSKEVGEKATRKLTVTYLRRLPLKSTTSGSAKRKSLPLQSRERQ